MLYLFYCLHNNGYFNAIVTTILHYGISPVTIVFNIEAVLCVKNPITLDGKMQQLLFNMVKLHYNWKQQPLPGIRFNVKKTGEM